MQNLSFIRLNDKLTDKDFIVATDPIIYVIENNSSPEDKSCAVYYNTRNGEIDYVTDSIENIKNALTHVDENMCMVQDIKGRRILLNPKYLLRLHTEGDTSNNSEITVVTLSDGTCFAVRDSITDILLGDVRDYPEINE